MRLEVILKAGEPVSVILYQIEGCMLCAAGSRGSSLNTEID